MTTLSSSQNKNRKQALAFGSGAISDVFLSNSLNYLAYPVYQIGLGLSPTWIAFVLGMSRLVDAFSDALVGHYSDRSKSVKGRRRPFVYWGSLLAALCFSILWIPPHNWSVFWLSGYFLVGSLFYYISYSVFTVPWNAMGLELSEDPTQRTIIQTYKAVIQGVGGILIGGMWWLSLKVSESEQHGMAIVSGGVSLMIIIFGVIPAFFCRERNFLSTAEQIPLIQSFKMTFQNRDFIRLSAMTVLVLVGISMITTLALYINLSYVLPSQKEKVAEISFYGNLVYQIMGVVTAPLAPVLSRKWGKPQSMILALIMVLIGFGSSWFCYTPAGPYYQLISLCFISPGLSFLWIIGPAMLSDIVQEDQKVTGLSRGGVYGGSFAWLIKLSTAIAFGVSGLILVFCGFQNEVIIQEVPVITKIRLFYALTPILFIAAAIWVAKGFIRKKEKHGS